MDQRGQLLRAAVGFAACSMPSYDRALWALRTWLDSWAGIGRIAVGMHRQGFDLQLTQYDDRGWRATFYTTGMEHSPTSATGIAWVSRTKRTVPMSLTLTGWTAMCGAIRQVRERRGSGSTTPLRATTSRECRVT